MKEKVEAILNEYAAGGLPAGLEELIQGWLLDQSSAREEKAAGLKALWDDSVSYNPQPTENAYRMYREVCRRLGLDTIITKPSGRKRSLGRTIASRAAAVVVPLIMVIGAYFFTAYRASRFTETTYLVPEGETLQRTLADGTAIWLNSGSKLVNDGLRSASLEGEAYFEVEVDRDRPFVVKTENLTVTVLGTKFNVRADPGGEYTAVALYRGCVHVTTPAGEYRLEPGSELVLDNATQNVTVSGSEDIKPEWMAKGMVFDMIALPVIFGSFEEIFGVSIIYDADAMAGRTVTLKLKGNEGLAEAMFLLSQVGGGFRYEINGNSVTVRSL